MEQENISGGSIYILYIDGVTFHITIVLQLGSIGNVTRIYVQNTKTHHIQM
jgi:hypothetical protein